MTEAIARRPAHTLRTPLFPLRVSASSAPRSPCERPAPRLDLCVTISAAGTASPSSSQEKSSPTAFRKRPGPSLTRMRLRISTAGGNRRAQPHCPRTYALWLWIGLRSYLDLVRGISEEAMRRSDLTVLLHSIALRFGDAIRGSWPQRWQCAILPAQSTQTPTSWCDAARPCACAQLPLPSRQSALDMRVIRRLSLPPRARFSALCRCTTVTRLRRESSVTQRNWLLSWKSSS